MPLVDILIYLALFLIGFVLGMIISNRTYQNKVCNILDTLKLTEKITDEQHDYFKNKYVAQQDTVTNIKNLMEKIKKKESG